MDSSTPDMQSQNLPAAVPARVKTVICASYARKYIATAGFRLSPGKTYERLLSLRLAVGI